MEKQLKTKEQSVFEKLYKINVNDKTEKKNGLTYLSWSYAWAEVKKEFPTANYNIYENKDGWNYFTDGRTAWVKTGVIIEGLEHIEHLPVMDNKNKSIPLEQLTSFDVNKAIQRSLTKACARHGVGLYIYAGEDLPDGEEKKPVELPDTRAMPEPTLEVIKEISQAITIDNIKEILQKYKKTFNLKSMISVATIRKEELEKIKGEVK